MTLGELGFDHVEEPDQTQDPHLEPSPAPIKKRRMRKALVWISAALAVILAAVALAIIVGMAAAPEKTKAVIGSTATEVVHRAQEAVGHEPVVVLGQTGGQELVDECPGYWVEIASYRDGGIDSPVFSAHNGCWSDSDHGAVILPLGIGDTLQVTGRGFDGEYKVTHMKDVPQHTSTTADIADLSGTLILQTCYWDDLTMKFIVLEPVQP